MGASDLLGRAKRGDRQALQALLEGQLRMVYRFVSMKLGPDDPNVDDVVQETLIAAAGSVTSLRAENDLAVPKWLLAIARHKLSDHLRRELAHPNSSLDGLTEVDAVGGSADVEQVAAQRERSRRLREAMRRLTPEQEEVVTLRFVLGFSGPEVAAITGRTLEAVKSLQHRAFANLEKSLAEAEGSLP